MHPKDLVGAKVTEVIPHHDYIDIVFDNGFKVEVAIDDDIEGILEKVE